MKCRPPRRFRPAGNLEWVEPSSHGPAFCRKKSRCVGAKRRGLIYEQKVHDRFEKQFGERYLPSQWFRFGQDGSDVRWCQPDGLLFNVQEGVILVVEIKYSHTQRAWWQLRQLYGPIVQFLFPSFRVQVLEVCAWYDCSVQFPERVSILPDYDAVESVTPGAYNLLIQHPRKG